MEYIGINMKKTARQKYRQSLSYIRFVLVQLADNGFLAIVNVKTGDRWFGYAYALYAIPNGVFYFISINCFHSRSYDFVKFYVLFKNFLSANAT